MTWHGRLRARFRGFGGWALAGHARAPDPEAARTDPRAVDLPIRVPAMDARFRRICAVFADGRCLIAEGYEPDDRLRLDLVALRQSGAIPPVLSEESVPLEEIAALWRAAGTPVPGSAGAAVDGGSSARRLRSLLADAAAARASDVVFEQGQDACKVFCIVNDRKLPLAAPLTAEEGRRLMGFLFHCKDEGSSQTSYRRASFQGFSIRAGGDREAREGGAAVAGLRATLVLAVEEKSHQPAAFLGRQRRRERQLAVVDDAEDLAGVLALLEDDVARARRRRVRQQGAQAP
ncbi:MAG: hypothetical protein OXF79_24490, partial [Chloroflexi bacterium]|nr:hypothetical protein [Chloroflexota bacterium]